MWYHSALSNALTLSSYSAQASLDMSKNQSGKHRRETVSSGMDKSSSPPVPPSSSSPSSAGTASQTHVKGRPRVSDIASPPKKKHRNAGNDVSKGEPDLSGGDDATNGGIQAVVSVARRARRSCILSAEKRRYFNEKYEGMTPEEILGASLRLFRAPVAVDTSHL